MKASAGRSAPLCMALGLEALLGTHTQEETLFLEKQSVSLGVQLVWPGTGLPWRMDAFPGAGAVGLALPSGWPFGLKTPVLRQWLLPGPLASQNHRVDLETGVPGQELSAAGGPALALL